MICRFTIEKKMPQKKLAKFLRITEDDLENIFFQKKLEKLIPKINLPLIKLYCRAKWKKGV